jgi:hypothetical protein
MAVYTKVRIIMIIISPRWIPSKSDDDHDNSFCFCIGAWVEPVGFEFETPNLYLVYTVIWVQT